MKYLLQLPVGMSYIYAGIFIESHKYIYALFCAFISGIFWGIRDHYIKSNLSNHEQL
jgi:hypothetical protein